jgi:hypothetical protein
MTTPQVPRDTTQPDYTKVRGWLLVFGILAGLAFLDGLVSRVFMADAQREFSQRLPATAAKVHAVGWYVGYLLLLVRLAVCIAIFRRLRIGRFLSLVSSGVTFLYGVVWFPFVGALVDASKLPPAPKGVDPVAYGKGVSTTITVAAYAAVLISLAFSAVAFLYFLRSERVKRTLVN